MDKLRVVIVPVKSPAYVAEIDNDLKTMQDIVGGYIETTSAFAAGEVFDDTLIVCNEEGAIKGLKRNKLGIRGQFFIISNQVVGDGEMVGLTEGKAEMIALLLNLNGG